jgi:hypothetical protein
MRKLLFLASTFAALAGVSRNRLIGHEVARLVSLTAYPL